MLYHMLVNMLYVIQGLRMFESRSRLAVAINTDHTVLWNIMRNMTRFDSVKRRGLLEISHTLKGNINESPKYLKICETYIQTISYLK